MLVSVIIPSFNHETFLPRAVESVLAQSHAEIELIVVDDGSEDGSVAYLHSVTDPRLTLSVQENLGAHAAINRGLEMSRGDYLAILNSDDEFHRDRIRSLLSFLKETSADFACSWIDVVDAKGESRGIKQGWHNMLPSWFRGTHSCSTLAGDPFQSHILQTNFVSTTSNMVFTRALYERIGGMRNLRFAHDWDFVLRVAAEFSCAVLEEPLVRYRLHGSNTIATDERRMMFETCLVVAANLHRYEDVLWGSVEKPELLCEKVWEIGATLVPKGCDRLFWMLKSYIDTARRSGIAAPETRIMDSETLKDAFLESLE